MRKFLSILALALCFVACQNEPVETVTNGDLVDVTLCLEAPELGVTRADGDGINGRNSALGGIDFMTDADWENYDIRYILEVYDANDVDGANGPIYLNRMVNCLDKYAPTTFALRLVPGRSYKFVVFADFVAEGNADIVEPADRLNISDLYYNTQDLRNISAITTEPSWNAMNEIRDAYFVSEVVEINGLGLTKNLTLKRPFAKLRVITTDLDYISSYATPARVKVTYTTDVHNAFNAVSGELNATTMAAEDMVYDYAISKTIPYSDGYDASSTNQTLFADYLLAIEGQQSPISFDMEVYDSNGTLLKATKFDTQIPVQRNHLTTVIGDLLTTQANIVIDINDDFVDEFVIGGTKEDNATLINAWGAGVLGTDGYEFTLTADGKEFILTVGANAVENNALKAGEYVLAEDAEEGDLTFTVSQLMADNTRAMVDVEVIGGAMSVAKNDAQYSINLSLVLDYGNYDVRNLIYKYEGPISFGATLDTPKATATVEGNVVTIAWDAVEGATSYTVTVDTEMPIVTEELSYTFTGEYATEYTISVAAINDDIASVPFTVAVKTDEAPAAEAYKLYFNNIAEWSKVYAHIWANEGEDLGLDSVDWPGRELTETETIDGVTYYVFQLPAEATGKTVNVVFNDGAGTQTKDLAGVVEGNLFFDNYVEPVEPSDVVLYLQPGTNWNIDGARFAAYFFGNGEAWVDATLVEGETNIYAVTVPAGFENIIFCRMNPNAAANNWDNKWNQTADLVIPTDGTNLYTVANDAWDKGNGTWSIYAPAVVEPVALATPVVTYEVDGNLVTLSWKLIDGAKNYTATLGDAEQTVEGSAATFEVAAGTYTATVVANPADATVNTASEAATVEVVVEEVAEEVEVLAELDTDAYYIFKQATEMKGGKWYAIVYENKAATGLTGNYGYLKVTEAITRANGISLPATCAYGFLTTDGGYTMQQFDGKYVYQTGSYNSFNVSADAPAEGGIWSVVVNGNEYTITNNTMNKFIQYDSAYNSYGCYADATGTIPTLYELVEVDNTPMILSVAPSALSFSADGESKTSTIETYGSATINVSDNADWVSTSLSGNVVTVTADANSSAAREAVVTVTYGNDSTTIAVSQAEYKEPSTGEGEVITTTVSFKDKSQRTSYSTSEQIWVNEGVTITNVKGSSTSNVGDYANPGRFYKSSTFTIEAEGNINSIVFDCTGLDSKYVTPWGNAVDGFVTITLDGTSSSYTIESLSAQARAYSITVTYTK